MNSCYDLTLKHPRRFIIYGPSGSGKTTFVEKLLYYMKELFGNYFDDLIYCSGQSFPEFNSIHGIKLRKLINIDKSILDKIDSTSNNLLILDDNMHNIANDILISDLFTKFSHHKNISVILLVQNFFIRQNFF